jgi:CheY-like chemotaxis protein
MPAMGGLSLFQELRRMGWQTPVILLTGHATGEELDALRAQGVSACLTKPPDLTRLARTISDALSSS